ncbi:UUP1 family membrane protein [Haloferula sargassicola]|uniref:Inactive transglutaminase fused to 7 transmembrane helices n=1 Tax=Haloferula sargassicola TaxID=490096 RepID=A0ABP9UUD9_9BACT
MRSRFQLLAIVILLTALGGGLAAYKHVYFHIPMKAGDKPAEWLVEAKITFAAFGDAVSARLALPSADITADLGIDAQSAGYSFRTESDAKGDQTAVWESDSKEGPQALYYRVRFPETGVSSAGPLSPVGGLPKAIDPGLSRGRRAAAQSVVKRVSEFSSSPDTLFTGIFHEITAIEASQEMALLKRAYLDHDTHRGLVNLGIDLLNLANVPARLAYGVRLDEMRGPQDALLLIEYFDGAHWKVRDPDSPAAELRPDEVFVWNRGGDALYEVGEGGENSSLVFSATRDLIPMERLMDLRDSGLMVATIFGLPVSQRQIFKFVVLIPIGAFVVVVLRNIIGLPTLGTFMPVLIALSLLEMDLESGLIMFVVIVAAGLLFRFLLSRLNLLVVPRVAACVVIVTLLMMVLSVVSWRLGMQEGLKITLFPMIILAWTIERMSLIWEEEGKRSALVQVGGSLIVAVIAFFFMQQRQIQYWAFYFPELLLVLLAGIILIGRYTGYRLSELIRFKNFEPAS